VDPAEDPAVLLGAVQAIEQKDLSYSDEAGTVAKTRVFVDRAADEKLLETLRTEYFALLVNLGETVAKEKEQSLFLGYLFGTADKVEDPAVALANLQAANKLAADMKASTDAGQKLGVYKFRFVALAKQLMGEEAAAKLTADDELSLIVGSLMAAAKDGKDAAGLFKDLEAAEKFVAGAEAGDIEKLYAAVNRILRVFGVSVEAKDKQAVLMGLAIANGREGRSAADALKVLESARGRMMNERRRGFKDKAQAAEFRDGYYALMRLVEPGADPSQNPSVLLGAVQAVEQKQKSYSEETLAVKRALKFAQAAAQSQLLPKLIAAQFDLLKAMRIQIPAGQKQAQIIGYLIGASKSESDPARALNQLTKAVAYANRLNEKLGPSDRDPNWKGEKPETGMDRVHKHLVPLIKTILQLKEGEELTDEEKNTLLVGWVMANAEKNLPVSEVVRVLNAIRVKVNVAAGKGDLDPANDHSVVTNLMVLSVNMGFPVDRQDRMQMASVTMGWFASMVISGEAYAESATLLQQARELSRQAIVRSKDEDVLVKARGKLMGIIAKLQERPVKADEEISHMMGFMISIARSEEDIESVLRSVWEEISISPSP